MVSILAEWRILVCREEWKPRSVNIKYLRWSMHKTLLTHSKKTHLCVWTSPFGYCTSNTNTAWNWWSMNVKYNWNDKLWSAEETPWRIGRKRSSWWWWWWWCRSGRNERKLTASQNPTTTNQQKPCIVPSAACPELHQIMSYFCKYTFLCEYSNHHIPRMMPNFLCTGRKLQSIVWRKKYRMTVTGVKPWMFARLARLLSRCCDCWWLLFLRFIHMMVHAMRL